MRRRNFSHLAVVRKKQVVGVLRFQSALAIASAEVVDRIDNLVHEDSVEGLQDMRGVQVEIAMSMLDDGGMRRSGLINVSNVSCSSNFP